MIVAVLQARMSSSRLPGKVMRPILDRPMIGLQLERIRRAKELDRIVVATSDQRGDDPVAEYAASEGVEVHRGSLDDVLDRFQTAAARFDAKHVVRLTADCPLADWQVIDDCVRLHKTGGADYTSNIVVGHRSYPDGLDVEVMTRAALEAAWREAAPGPQREHVTPYIIAHPDRFRQAHLVQTPNLEHVRWTVDTAEDFDFVRACYEALYLRNPAFTTADIHAWEAQRDQAAKADA